MHSSRRRRFAHYLWKKLSRGSILTFIAISAPKQVSYTLAILSVGPLSFGAATGIQSPAASHREAHSAYRDLTIIAPYIKFLSLGSKTDESDGVSLRVERSRQASDLCGMRSSRSLPLSEMSARPHKSLAQLAHDGNCGYF